MSAIVKYYSVLESDRRIRIRAVTTTRVELARYIPGIQVYGNNGTGEEYLFGEEYEIYCGTEQEARDKAQEAVDSLLSNDNLDVIAIKWGLYNKRWDIWKQVAKVNL